MRFVVKVDEFANPALPGVLGQELDEYERREDARLSAERYSGKVQCPVLVIEYDDAGNEVRVEEYDPEQGWLSEIGRKR